MYPPSLPKMKLPIVHPIRNPPSPLKMKLPIVCLIQNFSNVLAERSEQRKSTEMQKRPPKSSKNEMFIFGLHSTSDDWLSDLSHEC